MRSVVTEFVLMLSGSMVLTILAKSTVILLLGLVAGALAIRAKASWRHLVFATTFAAVLALPLVVLTIPDLSIEVPVAAQAEAPRAAATATVLSSSIAEPAASTVTTPGVAPAQGQSLPSMATILLVAWIAGALFLMLSLTVDLLRVRHLRRHGLPSENLRELVNRLTIEARLKPVDVMLHESIEAPVTFGFFQPAIMLPPDAENWSEPDLRRALVHELEHIRRGDWATQIAARAACAFYWFHPMVWMAWRRLCLEAERACDDAVVQTAGHTEYAQQLVSLSRQITGGRSQHVLGMAKRSDLARRVSSLLDETRRRGRVGMLAAACSVVIAAFVLVSIGTLRAVAQSASQTAAEDFKKNRVELSPLTAELTKLKSPVGDNSVAGIAGKDLSANTIGVSPLTAVSELKSNDDENIDDDDDDPKGTREALFKAAERNDLEKAKSLIESGANVNAVLRGDGTPLIAAAKRGHLDMVRFLLDRGAKPDLGVEGDGNPLTMAARGGHKEIVLLLLERGADINAGVEGDGNALIMAAGEGQTEIVTLLLDRGADIHKVVAGDENPIIKAAEQGQLEVIRLLVARGADINSKVRVEIGGPKRIVEWRTPLNMAEKNGHKAVTDYLTSRGAIR